MSDLTEHCVSKDCEVSRRIKTPECCLNHLKLLLYILNKRSFKNSQNIDSEDDRKTGSIADQK